MRKDSRILFLVGPRGSGKTTLGRLLARRLKRPFFDTDDIIMDAAGGSVADIVDSEGWAGFRVRESKALAEAVARSADRGASGAEAVISTGGGMILLKKNREYMREAGTVVYLAAPADCLCSRLARENNARLRPSLTGDDPLKEIARILEEREPLYMEAAHHRVDGSAPCERAAEAIIALLEQTDKETS